MDIKDMQDGDRKSESPTHSTLVEATSSPSSRSTRSSTEHDSYTSSSEVHVPAYDDADYGPYQ
eukprot:15180646-Alexandrium_andersonii.AAC.1